MKKIENKKERTNNEAHNEQNTFYSAEFNSIVAELKTPLVRLNIPFNENDNTQLGGAVATMGSNKSPFYTDYKVGADTLSIKASNGIPELKKYTDGEVLYTNGSPPGRIRNIQIDNLAKIPAKGLEAKGGIGSLENSFFYDKRSNNFYIICQLIETGGGPSYVYDFGYKIHWVAAKNTFVCTYRDNSELSDLPTDRIAFLLWTAGQPNWSENITVLTRYSIERKLTIKNFANIPSSNSNFLGIVRKVKSEVIGAEDYELFVFNIFKE